MSKEKPIISIIIPCYNHGAYIEEAISSVETYSEKDDYEIIIVDDGSTDEFTIRKLKSMSNNGYHIIFQENTGSSGARNNGITKATGDYILTLDSDNIIRPEYISKAIEILDKNSRVGVVYGNALLFGEKNRIHKPGNFDIRQMLAYNRIDTCAVFRKKAWEEVGGFDELLPMMGYEDWEFWIAIYQKEWLFHYIDEVLFEYRVAPISQVSNMKNESNKQICLEYIYKKHVNLVIREYQYLYTEKINTENSLEIPSKLFLNNLKKRFLDKLYRKNSL